MNSYMLRALYITGSIIGFSILSEVVWQLYRKYYRSIKNSEINEVIFTHDTYIRHGKKAKKDEVSDSTPIPAILAQIVQYIDAAQSSVYVCMYIFTCSEISEALLSAHNRGVKVLVIGEHSMAFSSGSHMTQLSDKKIPVRIWGAKDGSFLMHHKFCIIDGNWLEFGYQCPAKDKSYKKVTIPHNGLLITGSANWTMQALTSNRENIIVTSNKALIERFQMEFQRLWKDCAPSQN